MATTKADETADTPVKESKKNEPELGIWLIRTPVASYEGVTAGVSFRNGKGLIRGAKEPMPQKVRELLADFGYAGQFVTQAEADVILAKDAALSAERDVQDARKMAEALTADAAFNPK